MKRILVCCEDPPKEAWADLAAECERRLDLRAFTQPRNLRFQSLGTKLYESLNPLAADLARVGAYVYAADRLVSRGGVDVAGEKWTRSFSFVIPVSDPDLWGSDAVKSSMRRALEFLSEDHYEFRFVRGCALGRGDDSLFRDPRFARSDSVALFSGGLDSLSGIVWDHVMNERCPVLVSHRGATVVDHRQKLLVNLLRERLPQWDLVHAPAWINLIDVRDKETTQRARSFLYLSLAAAVAYQLGKPLIRVYENATVSINLPITGETVGARVTRTTHPKFLRMMSGFLNQLLECQLTIDTPFSWKTKKEVALLLDATGHGDLIGASTSCSHTYMVTTAEPHCGVCSQCIERRVALEAAELAHYDTPYVHDMWTDDLSKVNTVARAKAMVLGYMGTHLKIGRSSVEQLAADYPQVYDFVDATDEDPEEILHKIHGLYQRQAAAIRQAWLRAEGRTQDQRLSGQLSPHCLLRMLYNGQHTQPPLTQLARKIAEIAADCLPRCFATQQPEKEAVVQDALDSQLAAARMDIAKECPVVSFLVIKQARPDFSAAGGRLFVEVKYPRATRPAGAIAEEIASDLTQYADNGAAVLFVVYDPYHKIASRSQFTAGIEKHDSAYACVIS